LLLDAAESNLDAPSLRRCLEFLAKLGLGRRGREPFDDVHQLAVLIDGEMGREGHAHRPVMHEQLQPCFHAAPG
jgi:hypothetical protein